MLFGSIPGLNQVKQPLIRAVERSHVAHTLLFEGKAGGGALAMALAFATYVHCENRGKDDACGTCASCAKMQKLAHPDLHLIFPVVSGNARETGSEALMPQWREFIRVSPYQTLPEWLEYIGGDSKQGNIPVKESRNILQKLTLKAFESAYKILVIWKAELMNTESANALLKILEEPAPKTLFLLVTDQADKLLTTILSRAQRVHVPVFSDTEVAEYLQKELKIEDEHRIRQIAYLSDGNLAVARRLTQTGTVDRSGWFAEWMRHCYKHSYSELLKMADAFDAMPIEKEKMLLEYSLGMFRDISLLLNDGEELLRVTDEERTFVTNFSKVINPWKLEGMVIEITKAGYHIERNVRAKMVFLDLSLTLAGYFRSK